jgi:hypothetical protein
MAEEGRTLEVKHSGRKIFLENMNKKIVDENDLDINKEAHYNYACFEILDAKTIYYYPFNDVKYLSYNVDLPEITEESAVIPFNYGEETINEMLSTRMWKIWGQDDKGILEFIKHGK